MSALRQAFWFALLGAAVALLGATDSGGAWSLEDGTYLAADGWLVSGGHTRAGVIGAAAGAVTGLVLWAVGVRPRGREDDRIGTVALAGLLGAAVGLSPVLAFVGFSFAGAVSAPSAPVILAIYAAGGLLAYGAALAAVARALRALGDAHVRATVRTLAWALPLGAALATAAGVAAAATTDFSTTTATWIRAVIAALAVVAATLAAGRALAVRTARGAAPADPA
ncbi:hypothetical protein ACFWXB_08240 [Tsukamurella tyrosinosolvens]|uniref:hypothetical protein n=2 Tax=Tsukamurella tyrosinosolvens TaxID=57704 RepID=UPI00369A189E